MKKFILIYLCFFVSIVYAEGKYPQFIDSQLELSYKLNDFNLSQQEIGEILNEQKLIYTKKLEDVMLNKVKFKKDNVAYSERIFNLEKIIKINKKSHYKYAVIRDEIQIDSYKLLNNQRDMLLRILDASDNNDIESFKIKINEIISKNRLENKNILVSKYDSLVSLQSNSKIFKQAKDNLQELNALLDINMDIVNYINLYKENIFKLNKYASYHIVDVVIFINSVDIFQKINLFLEPYGLDIIKILFIVIVYLIIFFMRKVLYVLLENYLVKISFLEQYTKIILNIIRSPISMLMYIININLTIYIYNNFGSIEVVTKVFNILYALLFTVIVYRILNAIARIKIDNIHNKENSIKNEIINIGIKVLNFLIFLMGILIVLYFAGINLTAVLSGLGIGGFAVALAAKDTLANFFGTLSILLSDVFSQGDWIVVDGKEGVVVEIGLRVTTLRTFDNALIAIPNNIFANKDVKNWNKRRLGRRIKMSLGIKYDSKSSDIKKAVEEIKNMLDKHSQIATENTKYQYGNQKGVKLVSKDDFQGVKKTLLVYLDSFSDSSINILVYCFTKSVNWSDWLETKEDVMHKIMEILERNSLEFAFPSLSIYNEK